MSNPKHVQLKPEDAAKIVEVLADVETTAPRYFKKQGLSLQLMWLKREVRRVHAQYEREDEGMKTPTGVSRAVAEKLTRAYKVGHDVGLKGWAPSVEAEQFKTKLEQRYFWQGVCDAQVEKNHREDEE